jgi:hypothetical protein
VSHTSLPTPSRPVGTGRAPLSGGRVVLVVLGALLAFVGTATVAAGLALSLAWSQRDSSGFLNAGPATLRTDSYALASANVDVDLYGPDGVYPDGMLGTIRVQARSSGAPVFVGIGRTADVDRYLNGVRRTDIDDIEVAPLRVFTTQRDGGPPATAPGAQNFWAVSDSGPGAHGVTWAMQPGQWSIVIMNADASPQVQAAVTVGAKLPLIGGLAVGFLVGGVATLAVGTALVVVPLTSRRRVAPVAGPAV